MHGNIDYMEQPEEYQKMAVPGMLSDILRLQHRRNEPLEKSWVVKLQYGNVGVQSRRKSKLPPSPPLSFPPQPRKHTPPIVPSINATFPFC